VAYKGLQLTKLNDGEPEVMETHGKGSEGPCPNPPPPLHVVPEQQRETEKRLQSVQGSPSI